MFSIAVLPLACTHEYIQNVNPVCFEREVLPILQSNCTQSGCHNSQDREKGYDFSTYEGALSAVEAGSYRKSELYKVLVLPGGGEAMPPKPYNRLSDAQIERIALWIEEGANQTVCPEGTCDTTNATYSGTVKPIIDTYCGGCHSGSSPQGNIDYNTFSGVKTTVNNGSLIGSIEHGLGFSAMPKNGNMLSECNIQKIKTWVAAGAPNN